MPSLAAEDLKQLRTRIDGDVVMPDHDSYDTHRALWNGMVDKKPALICRCRNKNDVIVALSFAREYGLEIALRGAGHNIAGNASCNGGMVVDLGLMNDVSVDAAKKLVQVGAGATLGAIDAATQAHGLAVPVGINSTTGIAGLTLGGGFGWATRQFGLTIDALRGAEVVTVDGKPLYASPSEHPSLFWAIRGGGGNFGVVTRFDFEAYPLGPEVLAGLMVFPLEQGEAVLRQYRDLMANAPRTFNAWVVLRHAPPLPFLDESVHGQKVVVLAVCHQGEVEQGEHWIAKLRGLGQPLGEHIAPMPFVDWQQAFDPMLTAGARNYWKSHNFTELTDDALFQAVAAARSLPGPECEVFFALLEGAANEIAADATPWYARDAKYVMNLHARWQDEGDDKQFVAWAREVFDKMEAFASGGAYVNFMTDEEGGRIADAYQANYQRLVAIKRQYDPQNLLHLNQNIKPG